MTKTVDHSRGASSRRAGLGLKALVGAGDRIGLAVLPFLVVGFALSAWRPEWFAAAGLPGWARGVAYAVLAVGVAGWAWTVALILVKVPRRELITVGPFAVVKHPLYTCVALLVLPAAGVLLGSWLGAVFGVVMYAAARRYAPAEEVSLAAQFGARWDEYARRVWLAGV